MASTYTALGVELMATGENAGTWGTKTNNNLNLIVLNEKKKLILKKENTDSSKKKILCVNFPNSFNTVEMVSKNKFKNFQKQTD